jgi:hypothetical protein
MNIHKVSGSNIRRTLRPKYFRYSTESLQPAARMLLKPGHDHISPHTFQLIWLHCLLYIREIVLRLSVGTNGVPPPPKLQKDSADHPPSNLMTPGGEGGEQFPRS